MEKHSVEDTYSVATQEKAAEHIQNCGNETAIPNLGWLGTQVNQFVETMVCKDKVVHTGTNTNTNNSGKTNTQGQAEFSFFL